MPTNGVRITRELTAMFAPIVFGMIILIFCIQKLYTNPPSDERSFYFFTIGALMGIFVPSPIRSNSKEKKLPTLPMGGTNPSSVAATRREETPRAPPTPEHPNVQEVIIDHRV